MEKCICPFDFQEFSSRELLESHFSKSHARPEKETSFPELVFSSGSYLSIEDSPPEPVAAMKECLSSALKNVKLPQNPLSEIGEISENKLLQISNSPHIGALAELKLKNKGLSIFDSNERFTVSRLNNLTHLDLSFNYITNLSGVSQCINLSYLNLNKNIVEDLSPVHCLLKLVTLKASDNKIKDITPITNCKKLIKLELHNNQIYSFERTMRVLTGLPRLLNLSLLANPFISKIKDAKERIINSLNIEKLDKVPVKKQKVNEPNVKRVSYVRNKLAIGPDIERPSNQELQKQVSELKDENVSLRQELSKVRAIMKKLSISEVF